MTQQRPFARVKKRTSHTRFGDVPRWYVHLGYGEHEHVVWTSGHHDLANSYAAQWRQAARYWARERKGNFARVIPAPRRGPRRYCIKAGGDPEDGRLATTVVIGTREHTRRRAAQEEMRAVNKAFVEWKKEQARP